jgi:hypothetical protein
MRSLEQLAADICTLARRINAANFRFLELIAEFDRRNGWAQAGMQSCAHWLNWKCGIAIGAAREKVRVARALEQLPKVAAAMAGGQLSYSKAREITRIGNEHNEDALLSIAEHGTAAHVERLVRAYRNCQEAEQLTRDQRQQQNRRVSFRYDDDGSLILTCHLPAEAGARLMRAIEVAVEGLLVFEPDVPAGTSRQVVPYSQRRADALDVIAESFLAREVLESPGTDRHEIVVHVAAETLRSRAAGCCEIEHGPSIAAETARRLACDASVVALIESDGEPLSVGRKTRSISAPLRRLLKARDKGCRFPGCCNARYLDAHHIQHWANGGETKPANLVSLCRFHHRAVHEGGFGVQILDDGALRFVRPDGRPVDMPPPAHEQPGSEGGEMPVAAGQWTYRGDRLDLDLAVDLLVQRAQKGRHIPAGMHP